MWDNGPEFVSLAILERINRWGIAAALNDPGKPWWIGTDESFSGKFRDECQSLEWLRPRRKAAVIHGGLETSLQRRAPSQQPELHDPARVQAPQIRSPRASCPPGMLGSEKLSR